MKRIFLLFMGFAFLTLIVSAQNSGKKDLFTKVNNTANKVNTVLAVFQPYLLKARQLFYDGKQLASDVKRSSKTLLDKNNNNNNNNSNTVDNSNGVSYSQNSNIQDSSATTQNNSTVSPTNVSYNSTGNMNNNDTYNQTPQNYLPTQNLPVNNPATVNDDGTGNWGNQENGLYGNCLDVLTGTIMGLGEAEENPKSVDVIFIAANGCYQLWSPEHPQQDGGAYHTSRSTCESISKWSDVNETEIAETNITSSQFEKIQNNSQILNAVKNAHNYSSIVTEFGKLDGKVFAVRAELEDRTVYGLIEVVKHYGTFGSNGYLKIKIKAQGIDKNQSGQINVNAYQR